MNLYKINKEYSLFLFFFNIFILFTISNVLDSKEIDVPFKNIICFFLISIIGVSHGALDHIKGYKLMEIYKINNKYFFYPIYIFCCFFVIFFWIIFPSITLILFLLVASYHFGKEDSCIGNIIKKKFINLFYLFKGLVVVITPLFFIQKRHFKFLKFLEIT